MEGWPDNVNNIPESVEEYWKVSDQLHVADILIFVGEGLLVPITMKMLCCSLYTKVTLELRSVSKEVDHVSTGLL